MSGRNLERTQTQKETHPNLGETQRLRKEGNTQKRAYKAYPKNQALIPKLYFSSE